MFMVDIICHLDGTYSHVEVSVGHNPVIQFYGHGPSYDWLNFLDWKSQEREPIKVGVSVKDYVETQPGMKIHNRDDGNIILDASGMGVRHLPFIRLH